MNYLQRKTHDNVQQLYRILFQNTSVRSLILTKKKQRILDVGAGNGVTAKVLADISGHSIEGIDISNDLWEGYRDLPLTIYNGRKFPFKKESFDNAIIFLVLHHCEDPKAVLEEAKRVTKHHVFILEEVSEGVLSNVVMTLYDWLVNLIIFRHSIRFARFQSETSWENIFAKCNMKIKDKVVYKKRFFLKRILYILEKR